jgi:NMD protein affecting ribosome stability and mRNA decay
MAQATELNQTSAQRIVVTACSHCGAIRNRHGKWVRLPSFWRLRNFLDISHGICPRCAERNFPAYLSEED